MNRLAIRYCGICLDNEAIKPGLGSATPSALESIPEAGIAGLHLQHPRYTHNKYARSVTHVPRSEAHGGLRRIRFFSRPLAGNKCRGSALAHSATQTAWGKEFGDIGARCR
jgi:hypothetical protein